MSAAEQAAAARQQAERALARDRERTIREDAAAATAVALIAGAKPADASHPYLAAKGVEAQGLYVAAPGQTVAVAGADGKTKRYGIAGRLLAPLSTADGALRNVQTIAADGAKLYLGGAQKIGTFQLLGELRPERPVLIAEGYATAATVHRATGLPVAMALDTSNLLAVAKALRERHPEMPIYMAADNDHHLPRRAVPLPNAGREKAEAAAAAVGGKVLLPKPAPGRVAQGKGTDWNDYEAQHGRAAARTALLDQMRQAEALAEAAFATRPAEREGRAMTA